MSRSLPCVAALAAVAIAASGVEAQTKRFELIPTAGYTWGGSRDFDAQVGVPVPGGGTINVPGGEFFLEDSFSWGLTAAWEGSRGSYFTITYQRQDTKLGIRFDAPPPEEINEDATLGYATNAVIFGFRQEFSKSREQRVKPYIGFGLGFNVLDPDDVSGLDLETTTRFLISPHGGVRFMVDEEQRFGLQADIRGIFTFIPSGDYGVYCDYWYGCYAYEGTATLSQGTVSGGVVVKF
jgi:hypothetical protein